MVAATATATNPSLTSVTQRTTTTTTTNTNTNTNTNTPATKTPVVYSRRQQKPYNKADLHEFQVPDLTVKDLLSAIPPHCFERSAFKSFQYVFADFAIIALLAYAASFIDPFTKSYDFASSPLASVLSASAQASLFRFAAWTAYTFAQGLVFTGVWVIAHECGHQSFSTSKSLNNSVGWVLHSLLLVPYHSWRISHARHHAATGHLTRDEVFVPRTRAERGRLPLRPVDAQDQEEAEQVDHSLSLHSSSAPHAAVDAAVEKETFGQWLAETFEDAPLYNLIFVVMQQLLGWPLYLLINASGQLHYPKGTNHFNPDAIIFDKRHRQQVIVSDIGLGLVLSGLGAWAYLSPGGIPEVVRYYVIPYLWCNNWLVMITYLQHTDPLVPHYSADAWTFPRGALCTVDRNWLGPIGPYLFHGIAETHVAHHISSKIPHYNAWDATEALKQRLGVHYQFSDENVLVSLWKASRTCKFVEEGDSVAFYRDADGVPRARVAPDSGYNSASDSGVAMSE